MKHSELLRVVGAWDEELRADFEERAAIIEFMAHETRQTAERLAFEMLADRAPRKQTALDL
jgi:hypothetical protein